MLLDVLNTTSPDADLSILAIILLVISPVCLQAIPMSEGSAKSKLASICEIWQVTPVTTGSCNTLIFISLVVKIPSDTSPTSLLPQAVILAKVINVQQIVVKAYTSERGPSAPPLI